MSNFSGANATTVTSGADFIPELWSDEIVAAYQSNLVLANLVSRMDHNKKKGDTVHIPSPTRSNASAKAAATAVTILAHADADISISLNKHFEYSRLVDDIAGIQALESMRAFYTTDAGYALAKMVDHHLHVLGTGNQGQTVDASGIDTPGGTLTYNAGSPGVGAVIGGDGTTAWAATTDGNGTVLTDAGIRKMIQTLDDADVPTTERYMVLPPVERKTVMGLSRFTEQAFVGEVGGANTIRNGIIGDIYGFEVFVSTNCPQTLDVGGTTVFRAGMMLHKSAFVLVEQMAVRSQTQYQQQFLADLFTADTIYGVGELRDDASITFIVPA